MQKQKQIELLEDKVKELEEETQELTIINNNLIRVNEEHRKLNGELREEIDRLNKSLEEQRHFYLKKIEKLENHKRGMLAELFKVNDRIDKAIEYIENGILDNKINEVDWDYDECYFSDMPAERIKPLIDILKGEEKDGIMDKKSR